MSAARKTSSTSSTARRRLQAPDPTPPPPAGTPALQAPSHTQAPPSLAALQAGPRVAPASVLAPGGVGSGPVAPTRRKPRLNVTAAERLCYSRRRLAAISALRNVGIDPTICGLYKDYRVEGVRGRVYLVQHPHGMVYVFSTLAQIRDYAAERQARKARVWHTWDEWLSAPPRAQPRRAICGWPECGYEAERMLEGQLWCQIHGLLYKQMLLLYGRPAS